MTTTREEALEQGWLTPAPTFFGEDALVYFSKCNQSAWTLIRRTEPKPVLNREHPVVREALRRWESEDKIPEPMRSLLPHVPLQPRPFQYLHFAAAR